MDSDLDRMNGFTGFSEVDANEPLRGFRHPYPLHLPVLVVSVPEWPAAMESAGKYISLAGLSLLCRGTMALPVNLTASR